MQFHLQHLVVVVVVVIILFVVYTIAPEGAFLPAAGLVAGAVGVGSIANLLLNFVSGDAATEHATENVVPNAKEEDSAAAEDNEKEEDESGSEGADDSDTDDDESSINAEPVTKSVSIQDNDQSADGEQTSTGTSPQAQRPFSRPGTKQRIKPMVYAAPI